MAILAALLTLGSRFAGKILTTGLGWASTLLFGRVPADRQILVLGVTFGSVIWMVLLVGIVVPDVGAFLLVLLPPQEVIPDTTIRLIMAVAALIVPGVIGALTLVLSRTDDRSPAIVAQAVARGYPLTALLAVLLVFLAGLAIFRKVRSLARRWTEAHVPIVVRASAYDEVAADLRRAIGAVGLHVTAEAAPAAMSRPAQWLARVAGPAGASLVPDRLVQLKGEDLDILIYPMDLLISGTEERVNRARAAMASRLATSSAYLTTSAEAQAVEDRLAAIGASDGAAADPPTFDDRARAAFEAIDATLADIPIPYEEWEVLYRERLQVERDLRAGATSEDAVLGAPPTPDGSPLARVRDGLRRVALAAVELALRLTDDGTTRPAR